MNINCVIPFVAIIYIIMILTGILMVFFAIAITILFIRGKLAEKIKEMKKLERCLKSRISYIAFEVAEIWLNGGPSIKKEKVIKDDDEIHDLIKKQISLFLSMSNRERNYFQNCIKSKAVECIGVRKWKQFGGW